MFWKFYVTYIVAVFLLIDWLIDCVCVRFNTIYYRMLHFSDINLQILDRRGTLYLWLYDLYLSLKVVSLRLV